MCVAERGNVVGGGMVVARFGEIMARYGKTASWTSDLGKGAGVSDDGHHMIVQASGRYSHETHEILDSL
jgi:hypothetical protein